MQQGKEFSSEDDEKITTARFSGFGTIDLGSDSDEEMRIVTLGIAEDGPIDFGFNSGVETNVLEDVVPKNKRAPNAAWL